MQAMSSARSRRRIPDHALGLRIVRQPENLGATLDIIAIHGKGAHPVQTWGALRAPGLDVRDPKSYIDWLEDEEMLSHAIPTARIMRFGYSSDWFGENAVQTTAASIGERMLHELLLLRSDCYHRPLIFIAHSFGGLVLMKAVLLAKYDASKWRGFYDSLNGLVFLGTPFRGTAGLLHTEILHQAELVFGQEGVMHESHRASKAENAWLKDLVDTFCMTIRDGMRAQVACFYEEKPTDLGLFLRDQENFTYEADKYKVMHVSESSACLDRTIRLIERYPRACDHLSLNKFSSADHPEWKTLVSVLQNMRDEQKWSTELDFRSDPTRNDLTSRSVPGSERRVQSRFTQVDDEGTQITETQDRFLTSLFFNDIDSRRQNIKDPAPNTVDWIFMSPHEVVKEIDDNVTWDSFIDWLEHKSETAYWICGKLGSGKSTLAAHLVDDPRTKEHLRIWSGNRKLYLLSFYFWRPGSEMQKSTIGLLRSLLFQLCRARLSLIDNILSGMVTTVDRLGTWTEKALVYSITTAIHAAQDACYCIFLDGLDELVGDYNAVIGCIFSLQKLINVKCCLTSRPEIKLINRLSACKQLHLEDLNRNGIETFVESQLDEVVELDTGEKRMIQSQVVSNAKGVFLWAALVIQDLIAGIVDYGEDPEVLATRIDSMPTELGELFQTMLDKVDHAHRQQLAFYVSMLDLKTRFGFPEKHCLTTISMVTAVKMMRRGEEHKFLDKEFTKLCAQTEKQVVAQSAGLLQLSGVPSEASLRIHWNRADNYFTPFGRERLGAGHEEDLDEGRYLRRRSGSAPYPEYLRYNYRAIEWVHRSAYDFMFKDGHSESLQLLTSLESLLHQVFDAAFWLMRETPSSDAEITDFQLIDRDTYSRFEISPRLSFPSFSVFNWANLTFKSFPTLTRAKIMKIKDALLRMNPLELHANCRVEHTRYNMAVREHYPREYLWHSATTYIKVSNKDALEFWSDVLGKNHIYDNIHFLSPSSGTFPDVDGVCTEALARVGSPDPNFQTDEASRKLDSSMVTVVYVYEEAWEERPTQGESERGIEWASFARSFSFSLHPTSISESAGTAVEDAVITSGKLLLCNQIKELEIDSALKLCQAINMYQGFGLDDRMISVQFSMIWGVYAKPLSCIDDVRIVCNPKGCDRQDAELTRVVWRCKPIRVTYTYCVNRDCVALELTAEARLSFLDLMTKLVKLPLERCSSELENCRNMVVEDIKANGQGLTSKQQQLALTCVHNGFYDAFRDNHIVRFKQCFRRSGDGCISQCECPTERESTGMRNILFCPHLG